MRVKGRVREEGKRIERNRLCLCLTAKERDGKRREQERRGGGRTGKGEEKREGRRREKGREKK